MSAVGLGDFFAFAVPTAVTWAIGGALATMLVYIVPAAPPGSSPSTVPLLLTFAGIWGVVGIVIGVIALFDFVRLSSERGPALAIPTHFAHVARLSLGIGALLGGQLYAAIEAPPELTLHPIGRRLVVCSFAAVVATIIATRIIPKVPKLFE